VKPDNDSLVQRTEFCTLIFGVTDSLTGLDPGLYGKQLACSDELQERLEIVSCLGTGLSHRVSFLGRETIFPSEG